MLAQSASPLLRHMALHMHSFGCLANQSLICVACYVGAARQDAHCEKSTPLMSDVGLGCVTRICFFGSGADTIFGHAP